MKKCNCQQWVAQSWFIQSFSHYQFLNSVILMRVDKIFKMGSHTTVDKSLKWKATRRQESNKVTLMEKKKLYFESQGSTADTWAPFDGAKTNCFYWNITKGSKGNNLDICELNQCSRLHWPMSHTQVFTFWGKNNLYAQPGPEGGRTWIEDSRPRGQSRSLTLS